ITLFGGGMHDAGKPAVLVDGDSITVLAASAIHQQLDSSFDVQVQAVVGIGVNQSLPAPASALTLHPFAVLGNSGTNDALQGGTHPNWRTSWNSLIRMTRATPCVVLTTINPTADALTRRPVATKINDEIHALAARNPRQYKVAD